MCDNEIKCATLEQVKPIQRVNYKNEAMVVLSTNIPWLTLSKLAGIIIIVAMVAVPMQQSKLYRMLVTQHMLVALAEYELYRSSRSVT